MHTPGISHNRRDQRVLALAARRRASIGKGGTEDSFGRDGSGARVKGERWKSWPGFGAWGSDRGRELVSF